MLRLGKEELIPGVIGKEKNPAFWNRLDDAFDELGGANEVLLHEIVESIHEEVAEASRQSIDTNQRGRTLFIIFLVAGSLLGILFAFFITRMITGGLKQGIRFAEAISRGDLSTQLKLDQRMRSAAWEWH